MFDGFGWYSFPQNCLSGDCCACLFAYGWVMYLVVALCVSISSFELFAGVLLVGWFCDFL